jgi:hypothetical protein
LTLDSLGHEGVDGQTKFHEYGRSQVRRSGEIHVVVDNLGTHFTAEMRDWLADNPKITFHHTPVGLHGLTRSRFGSG